MGISIILVKKYVASLIYNNMKSRFLFILLVFASKILYSQDFLDGSFSFSSDKASYITLNDGKEIVGLIDDIDRKKGLIEEITIIDAEKKKVKLKPEEVKHMYIPPSGFDKLGRLNKTITNSEKWDDDHSAHAQHIKDGYVYFETTDVWIKKKKMTLLLQILNPGFARNIKVFFDPYAGETASFGFGGIKVAGGDAKSYYVKKGDDVAFRLHKKNYEEEFDKLFNDCPELKKHFTKDMEWESLEKHVFFHSEKCK